MSDYRWKAYGIRVPLEEYKFHPTRKWRFDFAWPENAIAMECDGSVWTQGRHTRGQGFINDMEKLNEAARLGWRVFRFTTQQFKSGEAHRYMKEVF
jgi:very-short-patch-repair endonuclease